MTSLNRRRLMAILPAAMAPVAVTATGALQASDLVSGLVMGVLIGLSLVGLVRLRSSVC